MKNLLAQIMKFGVVGLLAFVIDYGILNILVIFFHLNNVLAGTISFIISLIFNYVASMKYVFKHRDSMARWMEVLIFIVSAVIGLFINDIILWISTLGIVDDGTQGTHLTYIFYTNVGKIIATVIVSVWNFIIRKWLLDESQPPVHYTDEQLRAWQEKQRHSVATRLGEWSIAHAPFGWK